MSGGVKDGFLSEEGSSAYIPGIDEDATVNFNVAYDHRNKLYFLKMDKRSSQVLVRVANYVLPPP